MKEAALHININGAMTEKIIDKDPKIEYIGYIDPHCRDSKFEICLNFSRGVIGRNNGLKMKFLSNRYGCNMLLPAYANPLNNMNERKKFEAFGIFVANNVGRDTGLLMKFSNIAVTLEETVTIKNT